MVLKDEKNLAELSGEVEFTLSVLEEGDAEVIADEGDWFEIEVKPMFDLSRVLRTSEHDPETLLGFTLSDDVFTLSRQRMGYFKSQVNKILHRAVKRMRLGETAHVSFELDPDLINETFKKKTCVEKIYLDLKFEIHFVKVEKLQGQINQSEIFKLSPAELFELTNEHKKDANELFKKGLNLTAFHRYNKAMKYLILGEGLMKEREKSSVIKEVDESREEEIDYQKLGADLKLAKSQLYSNMAACQLKNCNFSMVKMNCTKCLEIEPANVKALFRRAQALTMMNDFDEAIRDFSAAAAIEPNNSDVKQRLAFVEQLKRQYQHKMSANLKKMFN